MPVRNAAGQPAAVKSPADTAATNNSVENTAENVTASTATNRTTRTAMTDKNTKDSSVADEISFICAKWADCTCDSSGKCNCGDGCACGTIPVSDVNDLIEKSCGFSDCTCAAVCGCGKACKCGSTKRTKAEWVEFAKQKKESA